MPTTDPRVDAYIAKSPDFAKPLLTHLRRLVHAACPQVQETMKWSFPHFMHQGIVCSMAAFKHHCAFGFWNHARLLPGHSTPARSSGGGMGQFGRLTALSDLPADKTLLELIAKAAALNDAGVKRPVRPVPERRPPLRLPAFLVAALKKSPRARATFDAFSYSHKKAYVEWLSEAKSEPTRQKRLATALAWLAEGKSRNWKYERC